MYSQPLSKQRKGNKNISKGPNLDGVSRVLGRKVGLLNLKYSVNQY